MICSHDLTKSQNPLLCEQGNIRQSSGYGYRSRVTSHIPEPAAHSTRSDPCDATSKSGNDAVHSGPSTLCVFNIDACQPGSNDPNTRVCLFILSISLTISSYRSSARTPQPPTHVQLITRTVRIDCVPRYVFFSFSLQRPINGSTTMAPTTSTTTMRADNGDDAQHEADEG